MNFDINELINSIVEFIQKVMAAFDLAIEIRPGYENKDNWPDHY